MCPPWDGIRLTHHREMHEPGQILFWIFAFFNQKKCKRYANFAISENSSVLLLKCCHWRSSILVINYRSDVQKDQIFNEFPNLNFRCLTLGGTGRSVRQLLPSQQRRLDWEPDVWKWLSLRWHIPTRLRRTSGGQVSKFSTFFKRNLSMFLLNGMSELLHWSVS